MRLPTDKVWRAFPELDRFSDEQCRGFVRAARRAWGWRLARLGVMIVATIAAFSCGIMALAFVGEFIERTLHLKSSLIIWAGAAGSGIGATFLILMTGMMARDRLLRRRIRHAIFNRGVCQRCDYVLVGMPVSAKNTVVCPECGMESEVDPALGELARDDFGKPVLRSVDERLMPEARKARVFTAARVKKAVKWTAAAVLAVVICAVGWYIWDRYETARQAEIATKEKPCTAGIVALQEKYLPPASGSNEPDGWELVTRIYGMKSSVDARVWNNANGPKDENGAAIEPNYLFFDTDLQELGEPERKKWEAERALSLSLLEEMRSAGVFDRMAEMRAVRRTVWATPFGPETPSIDVLIPELSQARALSKLNALRMGVAAEKGDLKEFAAALDANVSILRACRTHPTFIGQLVRIAIESLTLARVRAALSLRTGPEWLGVMEAAMDRIAEGDVPRGYMAEAERIMNWDMLAWYFSDPTRVSKRRAQVMFGPSSGETTGRLGTYIENRDAFDAEFRDLERSLGQERFERAPVDPSPSKLMFVNILVPSLRKSVRSADLIELERRGMRTMVALERYKAARGDYPARLEDLAPTFLQRVPIDSWSGKPLGYKRIDPKSDQYARGYVLYSVGDDGRDDGGKGCPGTNHWTSMIEGAAPNSDFILNDPKR